jgi:hypothetical protein
VYASISDWVQVPRDLETIGRSLKRKVFGLDNQTSYPLLSGDTFKFLCPLILEGWIEEKDYDFSALQQFNGRIFAQAEPVSNATKLLVNACKKGIEFPNAELVIHNGDVIPNSAEMQVLKNSFKKIYAVNWLGDTQVASPLPIGLENRDKRRNGVPSDYIQEIQKGLPRHNDRDILLLVAFSLHTNFKERSLALKFAQDIPGAVVITKPITPKKYRKLLLRSQFVLSPPGNGPDCHRTWEALYLGATPIVHRRHWPFLTDQIPVVILDSWDLLAENLRRDFVGASEGWKDVNHWIPSP